MGVGLLLFLCQVTAVSLLALLLSYAAHRRFPEWAVRLSALGLGICACVAFAAFFAVPRPWQLSWRRPTPAQRSPITLEGTPAPADSMPRGTAVPPANSISTAVPTLSLAWLRVSVLSSAASWEQRLSSLHGHALDSLRIGGHTPAHQADSRCDRHLANASRESSRNDPRIRSPLWCANTTARTAPLL